MLHRLRIFFIALLCSSSIVFAAPDTGEHRSSAFLFAGKKDWDNALLHAKRSGEPALLTLITWQYLLDSESGASFDDIVSFLKAHPDWPAQKKLRIRAEQSLKTGIVPDHVLTGWLDDNSPLTGIGKIALAEALLHQKQTPQEKIAYLVRDAWRNGDFDEPQEKRLLAAYGNWFRREDDTGRVDRLLWEQKLAAARRNLTRLPAAHQKLFEARLALIEDKKNAAFAVAAVPAPFRNDPGLLYDRLRYRLRHDDRAGVRELLLATPPHVPYPEKWWKPRESQVRLAVAEKNYALAARLLARHGQVDGAELADAIWLQGWLSLEFLNRPREAYAAFEQMYGDVRFPVSKARAAYWAARAAEKTGDHETAASWYARAASYPTSFYGQIASLTVNGDAPLRLPSSPAVTAEERQQFERSDVAQAAKLCAESGEIELANLLIAHLVEHADSDGAAVLAAELGRKAGQSQLSVRAAKKASQLRDVTLIATGYPTPKTPPNLPIERALALAITRQESEFDPQARSASGALGMMQLLLATGKEIAHKNDLGFSPDRLFEVGYNMTLGSLYLARLIGSYNGSYVMAIAAYNAGPGNVRNWTQSFGTPGGSPETAINWIEKIPFTETRNYVQRVLENLQIYRQVEAGNAPPLKLAEDMVR